MLYSVQIEVAGVLSKLQQKLEEYDTILWKKISTLYNPFPNPTFRNGYPAISFLNSPELTVTYVDANKRKCALKKNYTRWNCAWILNKSFSLVYLPRFSHLVKGDNYQKGSSGMRTTGNCYILWDSRRAMRVFLKYECYVFSSGI